MPDRILGEHFNRNGKPKKAFPTQAAAYKFIRAHHLDAESYACTFCGRYHLATITTKDMPT